MYLYNYIELQFRTNHLNLRLCKILLHYFMRYLRAENVNVFALEILKMFNCVEKLHFLLNLFLLHAITF